MNMLTQECVRWISPQSPVPVVVVQHGGGLRITFARVNGDVLDATLSRKESE